MAEIKTEDTRRDWEKVQENTNSPVHTGSDVTERLKIVGGHLYRTVTSAGVALVFVPGE